ncbi:hypothetical protein RZS08_63555, partial [Arthrospira platensis SPKY1]|nr:hypothetical protein [Arthrospira platensis SPKY1]
RPDPRRRALRRGAAHARLRPAATGLGIARPRPAGGDPGRGRGGAVAGRGARGDRGGRSTPAGARARGPDPRGRPAPHVGPQVLGQGARRRAGHGRAPHCP